MAVALDVESTLIGRYQATVPEALRCAAKLGKCDKIHYSIRDDGAALLTRAGESNAKDSVLLQIFALLVHELCFILSAYKPFVLAW